MPTKAKVDEKKQKVTKATKEAKKTSTKKAAAKNTTAKKSTKEKPVKAEKKATKKTTKKEEVKKEPAKTKKSATKVTATKKVATKKTTTKKTTTKKTDTKKADTKKADTKKADTKKTEVKTTTKKIAATKKTPAKNSTTTKSTTKKVASKKTTKTTTTTKTASKKKVVPSSIEYYDLPNNYNQTVVKVLFQTPKKLFVYWEISESDRAKLLEEHGADFFYHSTPYLIVRNDTKNYSFEIEINDFANSWYFDVPDSKCDYSVELIRRHHETNDVIQIRASNELEVPNNHILFEQNRREIFFINVKNNNVYSKDIANLQFIKHLGIARPITLNAFYNRFYDEKDIYNINNPSSY